MDVDDFFGMMKRNTWIFREESVAQAQLHHLNHNQTQDRSQFIIIRFELNTYRSVDLVGEFKIRRNRVKSYSLIRPCLTHNYLPEQIVDPQLKRGKLDLFVFNFNIPISEKTDSCTSGSIRKPSKTQKTI